MNTITKNTHPTLTPKEYAKFLPVIMELRSLISPSCLTMFDTYIESLKPLAELANTKNKLRGRRGSNTKTKNQVNTLTNHLASVPDSSSQAAIQKAITKLNVKLNNDDKIMQELHLRITTLEKEITLRDTTILNQHIEIFDLLTLNTQLKNDLLQAHSAIPRKKKDLSNNEKIKQLHYAGKSNRAIALELGVSKDTVRNRLKELIEN